MRMIAAVSSPESEPVAISALMRLKHIHDYILETSDLHLKQVIFLEGVEILSSSERYEAAKAAVNEQAQANINCARQAFRDLYQDYRLPIVASRISTREKGVLHNLMLPEDTLGYLGEVALADKSTTTWMLDRDIQLSLPQTGITPNGLSVIGLSWFHGPTNPLFDARLAGSWQNDRIARDSQPHWRSAPLG